MLSYLVTFGVVVALGLGTDKFARRSEEILGGDQLLRGDRAVCGTELFACHEKCIEKAFICDTINDCSGGFDEQNCPANCTGVNTFRCGNGKCIPQNYRCDTQKDCEDGTDELECGGTCAPGYEKCQTGFCVVDGWVCDGQDDCGDGSDERTCTGLSCNNFQFTCSNKKCIPKSYKCDFEDDCGDSSDEVGCTCDSLHFQCPKGGCIPAEYKCDTENDCGDLSDEADCPTIHPGVCFDMLVYEDCLRMNTTTFPICATYVDAHKYCRKFCGICSS